MCVCVFVCVFVCVCVCVCVCGGQGSGGGRGGGQCILHRHTSFSLLVTMCLSFQVLKCPSIELYWHAVLYTPTDFHNVCLMLHRNLEDLEVEGNMVPALPAGVSSVYLPTHPLNIYPSPIHPPIKPTHHPPIHPPTH